MAEMVAIKNGDNKTIGYRGVTYRNGVARDNGKSYNAQGVEVSAAADAISRSQQVAIARRNNPRNNPMAGLARQFGR